MQAKEKIKICKKCKHVRRLFRGDKPLDLICKVAFLDDDEYRIKEENFVPPKECPYRLEFVIKEASVV